MSPDPSQRLYADQTNPQSFNLYNYGLNNPLINLRTLRPGLNA